MLPVNIVQSSAVDEEFCALTDVLGGAGNCVAYGLVRAEDLVVVAALQPSMHPTCCCAHNAVLADDAASERAEWQRGNLEGLVAKKVNGVKFVGQKL